MGSGLRNYIRFNSDALLDLATECLALAEKQGTMVPLTSCIVLWVRLEGNGALAEVAHITIRRSRSTNPPSIVRWRLDLAKT